jgi:ParB family chromosome partitioning protein
MVKLVSVKTDEVGLPLISRSEMDEEKMEALIRSIESSGLIHPILVRRKGGKLEVVAGTRRLLASRLAKVREIPAVLRDLSDREALELMLMENLHREDLSAVDKGRICKELMERFPESYPTVEEVARRITYSPTEVQRWLKLAEAPKEVQEIITPVEKRGVRVPKGKVDFTTAYHIVTKVKEPEKQVELAKAIAKAGLPQAAARRVIKRLLKRPERKIEEVIKEEAEALPELIFRAEFKEPILKGVKVQTARMKLPKGIKKGAIVYAHFTEPKAFKLRITDITTKKLGELTEEDAKREGGYTLEEFREVWEKLMEESWDPDAKVFVIRFEVLGD